MPIGEEYGEYELDDDHWDLLQEALSLKLQEVDKPGDATEMLNQLKLNWHALDDVQLVQEYVNQARLAKLKEAQAAQEASLAAVQEEIDALEG